MTSAAYINLSFLTAAVALQSRVLGPLLWLAADSTGYLMSDRKNAEKEGDSGAQGGHKVGPQPHVAPGIEAPLSIAKKGPPGKSQGFP